MQIRPQLGIAALLVFSAAAVAQSPKAPPNPNQQEPLTEDLSHGETFRFRIAPELPEFTFKLIPDVQKPDAAGNPQSTIQEVQVFRGTSKEPFQNLEGCDRGRWLAMEPPYRGSDWFRVEDVNFDGYDDIFVLTTWGATGNAAGCVWLYNPRSGRFEFSKDFTDICGFEVHAETKTLTTYSNGGIGTFHAAKFVVENNLPVPALTVDQELDPSGKEYHCVIRQRRGGKLVTIRDVRAERKDQDDIDDIYGPCKSYEPFDGLPSD